MAYRKRLKTSHDCRRFLANVILDLEEDKITDTKAKAIGYLTGILLRAIEGGELERRLTEIEKRFDSPK